MSTTARLKMDNGMSFDFGIVNGSTFTISPMSTLDITLNTVTGFQRVGAPVSSRDLGGVSREISGAFLNNAPLRASRLINVAAPFRTGKLIYNDTYYCEIEIEKTPDIVTESALTTYDMMVYCPDPYWYALEKNIQRTTIYMPAFRFDKDAETPTFDSHTYATLQPGFCNLKNDGTMDSVFAVTFKCRQDCTNIGIINMETLEKLEIDASFVVGDTVDVKWDNGILTVVKNGETNILATLTDDSDLFYMHPGDNIIKSYSAEGDENVSATIACGIAYAGIHRAR